MKKIVTVEDELKNILKLNNIYLYGAGSAAEHVIEFARKNQFKINGIWVTKSTENKQYILGVQIREFKQEMVGKNDIILVCTTEKYHNEIAGELSSVKHNCIYYLSNNLFEYLKNSSVIEKPKIKNYIDQAMQNITYGYQRFIPRPCYELLIINILDHCNLRCKGCDHFACIADPYFVPYETIKRDVERISKIFHGDYIMQFGVMGGEPLLHPDLLEILKVIRSQFENARISVYTNGILLMKQKKEFWRVLRENNIGIMQTHYPIHLDFKGIAERAKNENVIYDYYQFTGEKKLFKKVVNLKGTGDPVESFAKCHISNYGNFLMEGKLYGCPFSCQSNRIFNKKFNQNLRMTEMDYLDIYKENDMQKFFSFSAKPKFYCRYCDGLRENILWERSKGQIEEWAEEVRIKE